MNLPSDYREVVEAGAAVLQALGAQLRRAASTQTDRPELWLAVRDYEGLAGRLSYADDEEWRQGRVGIMLSGQDFGVLDELIDGTHLDAIQLSEGDARAVACLRSFLRAYSGNAFT